MRVLKIKETPICLEKMQIYESSNIVHNFDTFPSHFLIVACTTNFIVQIIEDFQLIQTMRWLADLPKLLACAK